MKEIMLTQGEQKRLLVCRKQSLKKYDRVEFGEGILDILIQTFRDSAYLNQDNYAEGLIRLQDMFYRFKNETEDKLTDEELLSMMGEWFEEVCFGDFDYLETTCLERLGNWVRNEEQAVREGRLPSYETLSEESRWDSELYRQVLKQEVWGDEDEGGMQDGL